MPATVHIADGAGSDSDGSSTSSSDSEAAPALPSLEGPSASAAPSVKHPQEQLCCALSCFCPCLALAENQSILKQDYSGNHLCSHCTRNCAGCPCLLPCISAGLEAQLMNRRFDAHLPSSTLDSLATSGFDSSPPSGYRPPPAPRRAFLYAFCCYAQSLSKNRGILYARSESGTLGYEWEESLNFSRSQYKTRQDEESQVFKVAILGAAGTGKSAIMARLLNDGLPTSKKKALAYRHWKQIGQAGKGMKEKGGGALKQEDGSQGDSTLNVGTRMIHLASRAHPLFLNLYDAPVDGNARSTEAGSTAALDGAGAVLVT